MTFSRHVGIYNKYKFVIDYASINSAMLYIIITFAETETETRSYRNVILAAPFVVGLVGSIFAGFASVPIATAQSIQEMMNMTGIGPNTSLPFKMGELETPDIPLKCLIAGDVVKSVFGNITTVDQLIASVSSMLDNATGDTDGNETSQALMEMVNEQMQNMTDQDLQEELDFVSCFPVMDENSTQSMMGGGMIQ